MWPAHYNIFFKMSIMEKGGKDGVIKKGGCVSEGKVIDSILK